MEFRRIADKKVFPIGLGAMALDEYNPKPNDADAISLLRYAVSNNVSFIDTADVYGLGRNEQLIGKAFSKQEKEKILIATKVGCTRPLGYQWGTDGRPEHIREAVHESISRLGIKQIQLYFLHAPDDKVPFLDSIKALKELQDKNLVRHIGLSNVSLWELKEAQKIIDVVAVENHYNLAYKKDEKELLPYLTKNDIAYVPYFPLGSGRLLKNPKLIRIAEKMNATASQLALAWIINKWITAIPIPGTRNKNHLDENTKAAEIEMNESIIKELDVIY